MGQRRRTLKKLKNKEMAEDNNSVRLIARLRGLNNLPYVRCLAQCRADGRYSVNVSYFYNWTN